MEIKLTADEKLLTALEQLSAMLRQALEDRPVAAQIEASTLFEAVEETTPAEEEKPVEEPLAAVSREEVQSKVIQLIRTGGRDKIKAILATYGVDKVGDVPGEKLVAFRNELEAL